MTPSYLLGLVKKSHTEGRYDEVKVCIEIDIRKFSLFLKY